MRPREHFDQIAPGSRIVDPAIGDFEQQYGLPFFEWLRQNPEQWELFNLKMEYGLRDMLPPDFVTALQLPDDGTIVDIGGGLGYLLEQAKKAKPNLVTILCEQAFVCEQARNFRAEIDQFSSNDIVIDDLPSGDAYLLTRIIHDWPDDTVTAILRNIRRASNTGAFLKIIDIFLDEDRQGPPRALQQQGSMKMLCRTKQHTVSEIGGLLIEGGWKITAGPITLSDEMSCVTALPI